MAKVINKIFSIFRSSPDDGALTQLYAATSPEIIEKNYRRVYFVPYGEIGETPKIAKDDELAENLWKYTEDLIDEKLR